MEKDSFARAVEPEIETLYRVAQRMTPRREDAEDLVAQTLMQAVRGWSSFDGKHLRSWLIRILRNCHLNALRIPKGVALDGDHPAPGSLHEEVASKLELDAVLKVLDSLPAEYRLPITLCDLEEMDYRSAARALDLPLGTLQSRLFRGRKLLRNALRDGNVPSTFRFKGQTHAIS